jgi:20S proteasome subunit alpha 4|eukprot:TRINITY_DN48872_c0_g1_i1.p1 TRINITY_DN48872_c0_g1~~TRINITY_DN48872_c0_g1_i1.p1  ORF type:complete len:281 (+),score=43.93 TRINITY_DN48872_c0_g1_i1:2-844(+)
MSYDRAITVFSPDGHLFQVEYAMEAVRRGAVALGVVAADTIIFAVEKKNVAHLQDPRTIRKLVKLDEHLTLAFAGLTADSRNLIDRARVECQSHRLTFEEPASVAHIARFVAQTQQKFTQRGGRRPFGLSTLIAGFDTDGTPRIFQTDPSGTYSEWKACAIGRSHSKITAFLETLYFNEPPTRDNDRDDGKAKTKVASEAELAAAQAQVDPIKVAIQVLVEVVENPLKNIEIAVMKQGKPFELLDVEEIKRVVEIVNAEKEEMVKQGKSYEPLVLDSETY